MLELLRIKNLALISDLEMEFAPGLNALTGETGAGKSFILRAIDFVLGEKAGAEIVRAGADKAVVEALFVTAEGDVVIRREVAAGTGRSRLYINDALSSQDAARALKPGLLIHTSQHGQQRLTQASQHAAILDGFLEDKAPLQARDAALAGLRAVLAARRELEDRLADLEAKRDLYEFQKAEIAKVNPVEGEEEELETRKQDLQAAIHTAARLDKVAEILRGSGERGPGILETAPELARELAALAHASPDFQPEAEALSECVETLRALDTRLRRTSAGADPTREIEAIESRLWQLSKLKRALKRTMPEILALNAEIAANLSFLDACGLDRKRLAHEEHIAAEHLASAVQALNSARAAAATRLSGLLATELRSLGFSESLRVVFDFTPRELHPGITEDVARILWIPNPGQPPQPLDKIASGGELSRVLLALITIRAESDENPALLFDEVDAGIGGITLKRVGERLALLASRRQVILITHWPQLAALASRHFLVSKREQNAETFTSCSLLSPPDVLDELTRMGGGGPEARELASKLRQGR